MLLLGGVDRHVELECIELEVVDGPDTGRCLKVSLPCIRIGSAPGNEVVLSDPTVSRCHAEVHNTPKGLVLRDLQSTNGTFCNGVRVTEAYLQPDMTCELGGTRIRVRRAVEHRTYRVGAEHRLGDLVGGSRPMRELYGLVKAVAPGCATVLIEGESGAGKEVVARTLHDQSGRGGPLVVFDASVTDPEMVRNDLFGHVKGAFTGAATAREGAFRRAHEGTLFIDEIGELPLALQPRLLRVLETRELLPIGSDCPVKVDVRVVAATHRDLEAMVAQGTFRADLYFRLSVVRVQVPPLREIREDIPLLLENFARQLGLCCRFSRAAMELMSGYHWPGNVRELRNVLERSALLAAGGEIRPEHLNLGAGAASSGAPGPSPAAPASLQIMEDWHVDPAPGDPVARSTPMAGGEQYPGHRGSATGGGAAARTSPLSDDAIAGAAQKMKDVERLTIQQALQRNDGNKAAAARELGISLSTLKRRVAAYDL